MNRVAGTAGGTFGSMPDATSMSRKVSSSASCRNEQEFGCVTVKLTFFGGRPMPAQTDADSSTWVTWY